MIVYHHRCMLAAAGGIAPLSCQENLGYLMIWNGSTMDLLDFWGSETTVAFFASTVFTHTLHEHEVPSCNFLKPNCQTHPVWGSKKIHSRPAQRLHPGKLTWILRIHPWKIKKSSSQSHHVQLLYLNLQGVYKSNLPYLQILPIPSHGMLYLSTMNTIKIKRKIHGW